MANGEQIVPEFHSKWIATDQIDGVLEYLKAIDWSQRWLIALMIIHVLIFLTIVLNQNRTNVLVVIFAILLVSVFFSEKLNSLAAANWKLFASEQYFDSSGLFISVVFSTPILFNSLIIIVIWLWDSSKMVSVVTKHRRKRYQRAQQAAEKDEKAKSVDEQKKDK
ncbi:transmembrane protein 18-like [Dendronephthya gigantea]|uniref:transmembrane protein 18-like n=1 Tax=Dendronephthya gigantea TaxID=151771 RepID=UPI00106D2383|nr:transmembrane protein 18-like [Dendronephthya gigantea]